MAGVAYATKHWRDLILYDLLLYIPYLPCYWYVLILIYHSYIMQSITKYSISILLLVCLYIKRPIILCSISTIQLVCTSIDLLQWSIPVPAALRETMQDFCPSLCCSWLLKSLRWLYAVT